MYHTHCLQFFTSYSFITLSTLFYAHHLTKIARLIIDLRVARLMNILQYEPNLKSLALYMVGHYFFFILFYSLLSNVLRGHIFLISLLSP